MRSMERALLLASRTLVVAALPSADAVGALAWLARQGFIGALKNGLLRALVEVLAQDPACACAKAGPVDANLLERFALEAEGRRDEEQRLLSLRGGQGAPAARPARVDGFRAADGRGPGDRRRAGSAPCAPRARGLPPLLDLALRRAEEGGGGEMAGVERLLAHP